MNRSEIIRARCLPVERAALEESAKAEFLSLAEALRLAVREMATRRGFWPPPDVIGMDQQTQAAGVRSDH